MIGAPWLVKTHQRNQVKSAAREIQTTLLAARMKAVRRNQQVSVVDRLRHAAARAADESSRSRPLPRPTPVIRVLKLPASAVEFVTTPASGGGIVIFGGDGRLVNFTNPTPAVYEIQGPVGKVMPTPVDDQGQRGRPGRGRDAEGLAMKRRAESGVTLVELLIALALLGFILLGIAPLFIASVKSNYSANEYTSIHNLARDRLEQLMNLPFNDPGLSPGVHNNDLPPAAAGADSAHAGHDRQSVHAHLRSAPVENPARGPRERGGQLALHPVPRDRRGPALRLQADRRDRPGRSGAPRNRPEGGAGLRHPLEP